MKYLVYVVVAVIAAAAGFGIYQYGIAPRLIGSAPAAGAVVSEAPPAPVAAIPASGGAEARVPDVLPEFTLTDREGVARSIRSWPGKSMVVNFWATWCAPCRRDIPLLKELQQQHGPAGVQIVGVAVDFREDVLKYAQEIGIDYPLLIGEQDGLDAVTKFGMGSMGFPFTVFTDNQTRIVATHLGELTRPQSKVLLDAVARVNRGELTPGAARSVVAKQLAQIDTPAI